MKRKQCPKCNSNLTRIHRYIIEKRDNTGKFNCPNCGWEGLLPLSRRKYAGLAGLLGFSAIATVLVVSLSVERAAMNKQVLIGPHVVFPGAHLEGDMLPKDHAFAQIPGNDLSMRQHCAWGIPGRSPYRGTPEQALRAANLPSEVISAIAKDISDKKKVDRVTISNAGIIPDTVNKVYSSERVSLTYGQTMCVDSRVNFKPGHTERADLYHGKDINGKEYAVMVPDVCGNVSVLGERKEEGGNSQITENSVPEPGTLVLLLAGLAALFIRKS